MQESVYEKLKNLEKSDIYPFHMPGHKRNKDITYIPCGLDITEIDGFDNLHHATGILKDAKDRLSALYGSDKSWYLVNGSTSGLLISISAVSNNKGGSIIMARNCHKSAYNGAFLNRLDIKYIYPEKFFCNGINLCGSISPEAVDALLKKNKDARAVVITSPTYDGIVSDIASIARICHHYEVPLIVDEAHGAHFVLGEGFPLSALDLGADIVIHSLHKTLPSMTQTAVLHVKSDLISHELIERYSSIYQSSSPSYIFMAGMDGCIRFVEKYGEEYLLKYKDNLREFSGRAAGLKNVKVYINKMPGDKIFDKDCSKIIISVADTIEKSTKTICDGQWLYEELLNKFHLQMEMAASEYVIALTSVLDTKEGFLRLADALFDIDGRLEKVGMSEDKDVRVKKKEMSEKFIGRLETNYDFQAEVAMTVSDALGCPVKTVGLEESIGEISAEYVCLYPPGCPIIVPGEVISQNAVSMISYYKKRNYNVEGLADFDNEYIRVCDNTE